MTKLYKVVICVYVFASYLIISANAHGEEMVNAHGTLNVVLASEKGIVIASDSRLTRSAADGKTTFQDNVVKLFDVGGVVVTVAGFYSGGTTIAPNLYGSIPGIITQYSQFFNGAETSYTNIVRDLLRSVEFNLSLFTSVEATAGAINAGNYGIHLMFTKVEGNKILFNKAVLSCSLDKSGHLSYSVNKIELLESEGGLNYQLGGASVIAEDILKNPEKYVSDKYPIVALYSDMKKKHIANQLDNPQLEDLGRALIAISETQIAGIGGPVHVAAYEGGKFKLRMPTGAQPLLIQSPYHYNLLQRVSGDAGGIVFGKMNNIINVFVDSDYSGGQASIANSYYFGSKFSECTIKLENNVFFFSNTNKFYKCSLIVGKGVKRDSFVQTFIDSQKWDRVYFEK